jgi:hypothetical protein
MKSNEDAPNLSQHTPEVRIYFADLLYYGESRRLAGERELESYDYYQQRTAAYRQAWQRHEQAILPALQKALGVRFYRSVIDVACAPFFVPKSEPLIMSFHEEPDEFVDSLTHELCHVLLTDNDKVRVHDEQPSLDLIAVWLSLFGKHHDFNALVHIPVHAMSKYIYLDVLKEPSRLERDISAVKNNVNAGAYVAAWDYVNEHDYTTIIRELKRAYAEVKP